MTLKTRRILYIIFILAFFIITPTLILYSMGYTLNSGFKLEKSGILVIKTEPEGAKIYLNNKPVQKIWNTFISNENNFIKTPAKIKNLKSGEYEVRIEYPGYWPWTKKLTINPGLTTFAEDVFLFRNDQATIVKESREGASSFSPNKDLFVHISTSSAELIDLKRNKNEVYNFTSIGTSTDYKKTEIAWSSNNKKILTDYHVFLLGNWTEPFDISSFIGKGIKYYNWNGNDEETILYLENDRLFSFNTRNNSTKDILAAKDVDIFTSKNDILYLLKNEANQKTLHTWQNDQLQSNAVLNLPNSQYSFIYPEHDLINLIDLNNKILYLIDANSRVKPLKDTINSCSLVKWVGNDKILYSDGFEIRLYELQNNEKRLLTRISDPITSLEWHSSNNYIFFSTGEGIYILELDNREKHNITKIVSLPGIQNMMLDEKGEILYFTSQENGLSKLYKINIQ